MSVFPMMTPNAVAEWEQVQPLLRELGIEPTPECARWCAIWSLHRSRSLYERARDALTGKHVEGANAFVTARALASLDEVVDEIHEGLKRKLRRTGPPPEDPET